jgi:hypothetical protein
MARRDKMLDGCISVEVTWSSIEDTRVGMKN